MRFEDLSPVLKTILISSFVSLVIGFSFGWLIKSASSDLDRFDPEPVINVSPDHTERSTPTPSEHELPGSPSSNHDSLKKIPIGTAAVPEAAKQADRAKWIQLIEILGLNDEQAKALEVAMAESLPISVTGQSPEITYIKAGALLEKRILAVLDAGQRKAFAEMQRRAMENRIEIRAQTTYSQELGKLDLSAEQREKALDLLRRREKQIYLDIPSSTRLLLTGSFLPIGDSYFSEDNIRLQRQISPQDSGDITLDKLAENRRAEAEEKGILYQSFLTPAQFDLYRSQTSASPDLNEQILPDK